MFGLIRATKTMYPRLSCNWETANVPFFSRNGAVSLAISDLAFRVSSQLRSRLWCLSLCVQRTLVLHHTSTEEQMVGQQPAEKDNIKVSIGQKFHGTPCKVGFPCQTPPFVSSSCKPYGQLTHIALDAIADLASTPRSTRISEVLLNSEASGVCSVMTKEGRYLAVRVPANVCLLIVDKRRRVS